LEIVSDSGELRRNWDKGIFTIDTTQTQAAMGWIGGANIRLANVEIASATPNAVVAVQSIDGKPIGQSRDIIISVGARSVPKAPNSLPYYSEPVEGKILIGAASGLNLSVRDPRTGKLRQLPSTYADGHYVLKLDPSLKSSWLSLKSRLVTSHEVAARTGRRLQ
jgi:hypothetical protein